MKKNKLLTIILFSLIFFISVAYAAEIILSKEVSFDNGTYKLESNIMYKMH